MKRILLISTFVLIALQSATGQRIWCDPVVYLPDEQVTWYFDMSEYMQVEGEPFYIWSWSPSNPEDVLGTPDAWDNPSDACTLKYVGNGVYKLTLTPTVFYGVTAEQLFANSDVFWMNIRNGAKEVVTGSVQGPHPFHTEYQNFVDSETGLRVYPQNFSFKDNISILVNLNYLNVEGQGVGALVGKDFGNLHLHSGLNEYGDHVVEANMGDPVLAEKTKFKKVAENIYKLDMKPQNYYGITDEEILGGYQMKNIMFSLPTTDWVYRGISSTGDFKLYAADVEPDPDPVFSYFPRQLSQLDFLTLIRTYDNGVANLKYTITAGSTTLTGDFEGSRAKRTATINLFSGLQNEKNLTKLHVRITRQGSDSVVEELDIPLVSLSELE